MKKLVFNAVLAASMLLPVSVLAHELPETANPKAINARAVAAEKREQKLEGAKLRVCENREKVIKRRLDAIVKKTERHLEVFDKIAERVKEFKENKERNVANYDALMADISAKRAAVIEDLNELKDHAAEFDCDTSPKETAQAFKTDLKTVNAALKDYRTSIRNLIVAVKSAQGSESSGNENVGAPR